MLQGSLGPKTQNLKYAQAGVPAANLMPCPNSGAALRPAKLDSGHPGFNPSGGNMLGPNGPSSERRASFFNKQTKHAGSNPTLYLCSTARGVISTRI